MSLLYRVLRRASRGIFFVTLRAEVENARATERPGGFVLAVTHLSHLEPVCSSVLNTRHIDWVTRKEFFCTRAITWALRALNTIRVDRQGIPVSTIRTSIRRIHEGRVVGIFPEGGVRQGPQSVIRGGQIKKGCCSIAIRSGAPIIPCVMLGTDKLNAVKPWIPFRRGKLWIAYGDPIFPPVGTKSTRAARAEMAAQITSAFGRLYGSLRERHQICDSTVP